MNFHVSDIEICSSVFVFGSELSSFGAEDELCSLFGGNGNSDVANGRYHIPRCVSFSAVVAVGVDELYHQLAVFIESCDLQRAKGAFAFNNGGIELFNKGLNKRAVGVLSGVVVCLTDVCANDAELALAEIGQIDGRTAGEDIVSAIFSRFCVGK